MKALSLFTGYGGIDLALQDYITEVAAYVEIEEYAQRIIAERMADGSLPRAPILADVKNVEGKTGDCDIIYGGFPCQDISVAGLGKGLAGERSGLFYEIVRLTKEIRPTFVFLENVPAIRTRGLEQVIKAFAEIGYDCRWTMLSAASVGANHKRERWFLLANTNCDINRSKVIGHEISDNFPDSHSSKLWQEQDSIQRCKGKIELKFNGVKEYVADSSSERLERQRKKPSGIKQKLNYASDSSWWKAEPDVGRVVNGTSFRMDRIKALGNGVVPLQVKTAFEILIGITQVKA